jgi:hypothetical protein
MILFLDSNYRNALLYGGRQLSTVFSESVQCALHNCSDRAATISQISYCLRQLPTDQRVAIVFGGFENFSTGTRSSVQLAPLAELKSEISDYVQMIKDILTLYPHVTVYVLPPIFGSLPTWFASSYESMLPNFLSDVSHINPVRAMVVPPLIASLPDLDFDGVHLKPPCLQRLLDLLLVTFRDGVFVNPDDCPVLEDICKLVCFFILYTPPFFILFFAHYSKWPY